MMRRGKALTAPPDAPVCKAARLMARRNAGAVLVVEGERLVGIFTERDVVFRVVARRLDTQATRLADVMTPAPCTIGPDKTFGYALVMMHEGGFRHLPVVEDGKVLGIVSSRNALDSELIEFRSEVHRRKHFAQAH